MLGLPERGVDPAVPDALALLGGWDTTWYLDVARFGYEHDLGQVGDVFTNLAFFPLLPGLMALFLALGINPFVGALVVSNLAFLGALAGLHALTARASARRRVRATWTLAFLPPAVYASLAYTGGHRLACAVAAGAGGPPRPVRPGGPGRGRRGAHPPDGDPGGAARRGCSRCRTALRAPAPRRPGRPAAVAALAAFLAWMAAARGSALLPFEASAPGTAASSASAS